MSNQGEVIYRCAKCGKEMTAAVVRLNYLGHTVEHKFPKCPVCGQIYISEEIVREKMHEVEINLEDK